MQRSDRLERDGNNNKKHKTTSHFPSTYPRLKHAYIHTSKTKGTRVTTAVVRSTQPVRPVFFAAHCAHPNPATPSDLPVTTSVCRKPDNTRIIKSNSNGKIKRLNIRPEGSGML